MVVASLQLSLLIAAALALTLPAASGLPPAVPAQAAVKLIIDTDIGGGGCSDVDDVVAVCIANALTDNGEAELLAVARGLAGTRHMCITCICV